MAQSSVPALAISFGGFGEQRQTMSAAGIHQPRLAAGAYVATLRNRAEIIVKQVK
jgi:hypothetical protein